jgi:hypothetical protein
MRWLRRCSNADLKWFRNRSSNRSISAAIAPRESLVRTLLLGFITVEMSSTISPRGLNLRLEFLKCAISCFVAALIERSTPFTDLGRLHCTKMVHPEIPRCVFSLRQGKSIHFEDEELGIALKWEKHCSSPTLARRFFTVAVHLRIYVLVLSVGKEVPRNGRDHPIDVGIVVAVGERAGGTG